MTVHGQRYQGKVWPQREVGEPLDARAVRDVTASLEEAYFRLGVVLLRGRDT